VNLSFDDGVVLGLLPHGAPLHPWALAGLVPLGVFQEGQGFDLSGRTLALRRGFSLSLPECLTLDLAPRPHAPPNLSALAHLLQFQAAQPTGPQDQAIAAALQNFLEPGDDPRRDDPRPGDGPRGDRALGALQPILGLGDGLTPSGDDAICGALCLLRCAEDWSAPAKKLLAPPPPSLDLLTSRTARLSAQLLHSAFLGRFGEPLLLVAEALENNRGLDEALQGLLALGHNSGRDTLLGLATVARFLATPNAELQHADY
jgi:hypothetical protein